MSGVIIAGTGHRPVHCPCGYDENHPWLLQKKNQLRDFLIKFEPSLVITGMAIGWDTWLAQEALFLDIPIACYVPFPGQQNKWPEESRRKYDHILSRAKIVNNISDSYSKSVFFKRDEAMVNSADEICALLNPEIKSGGTFYTVNYALKQNKKCWNLWDDTLEIK
jgi:uncharacterized phage-like protein YoqJ